VPGQAIGQADYVLIAGIVEVQRLEQQASEHVQRLADDWHISSRAEGCSSCVPSFEILGRWTAISPGLGLSLRFPAMADVELCGEIQIQIAQLPLGCT
jgi:hypothetical protein